MNGIICFIGIGSNIGNALKNCQHAVENLLLTAGIEVSRVSSFYKTEPVGVENQNMFINGVVEIRTALPARKLFQTLQNIEKDMGRVREVKGGPRIIDLDLLFYGQEVIHEADLIVPHPEIQRRRFVLEPICEIASYFIHPDFGVSMRGLKDRLNDKKRVEIIKA